MQEKIEMGKPIGVIRVIDSLGRLVIPSDMRKFLQLGESVPVEIFLHENGFFVRKLEMVDEQNVDWSE